MVCSNYIMLSKWILKSQLPVHLSSVPAIECLYVSLLAEIWIRNSNLFDSNPVWRNVWAVLGKVRDLWWVVASGRWSQNSKKIGDVFYRRSLVRSSWIFYLLFFYFVFHVVVVFFVTVTSGIGWLVHLISSGIIWNWCLWWTIIHSCIYLVTMPLLIEERKIK